MVICWNAESSDISPCYYLAALAFYSFIATKQLLSLALTVLQALAADTARVYALRDDLLAQQRTLANPSALGHASTTVRAAELASREAALEAGMAELAAKEKQLDKVCIAAVVPADQHHLLCCKGLLQQTQSPRTVVYQCTNSHRGRCIIAALPGYCIHNGFAKLLPSDRLLQAMLHKTYAAAYWYV